jgi:hypothetical protein
VCLGAGARAANEAARRQYKYANEKRKRNWLQQLGIYGAKKVQGVLNIAGATQALTDKYGLTQLKKRAARGSAEQKYLTLRTEMMQNNKYSKMIASGATGKSISRLNVMEMGAYGRQIAEIGSKLRANDFALDQQDKAAWTKTKSYIRGQEAQTAFQPMQSVEIPQPVMQDVGMASFMEALGIGSSLLGMASGLGSFKGLGDATKWFS